MTFKKADMAKTLKIRFSMIETNPLNHKWLDFVILTGLALHQFQTNWLLSARLRYIVASRLLKAKQAKYGVSERPVYFCTTVKQKECRKNTLLHVCKVVNGPCAP